VGTDGSPCKRLTDKPAPHLPRLQQCRPEDGQQRTEKGFDADWAGTGIRQLPSSGSRPGSGRAAALKGDGFSTACATY
jgi:hypothetical protein